MNNAKIVSLWKVNKNVCDALGIDPTKIRKIVIRLGSLNELPECDVTFIPETKDLVEVLRRYNLVPKDD